MSRAEDFSGRVFGRLTVIREADPLTRMSGSKDRRVECVCECGTAKTFLLSNLKVGHSRSCGCLNIEQKRAAIKHGGAANDKSTPEYMAWVELRRRCREKDNPDYSGRGITVCDRWNGPDGFQNFLSDMGRRPIGHSMDRIDVNGNYCPENCRWASIEQQNNNKRTNRWYEHDGKRMTIGQWHRHLGWPEWVIYARLKRGLSFSEAVEMGFRKILPTTPASS